MLHCVKKLLNFGPFELKLTVGEKMCKGLNNFVT